MLKTGSEGAAAGVGPTSGPAVGGPAEGFGVAPKARACAPQGNNCDDMLRWRARVEGAG